ncbi:hypothetical protein E2C01_019690 [Portunus trituberculatus]|uniref:Uncharacterized protein n=1 Tax=Portunus trituberculatus TaxID=210409 RepID=A0A5B7DZN2_PORTR|nr:hypothetical protein [Portunus trituberculatus]
MLSSPPSSSPLSRKSFSKAVCDSERAFPNQKSFFADRKCVIAAHNQTERQPYTYPSSIRDTLSPSPQILRNECVNRFCREKSQPYTASEIRHILPYS